MMKIRRLCLCSWACVSALLAGHTPLGAATANDPKAYALTWPVVLDASAPQQRLLLPAEALLQLQTPGYSDLRLFNAQGQALAMALTPVAQARPGEQPPVRLVALPIMGASHAPGSASTAAALAEGVSLRIEEHLGKRVVQINTAEPTGSAAQAAQVVLGALLDARAMHAPVVAITLDVDLPKSQPITFKLQASKDLKTWHPLASTVLYRPDELDSTATELGSSKFELPLSDLKDHYLRVTWADNRGQLAAVILRSASITSASPTQSRPRVKAHLALPADALVSPHELRFSLPFATPLAALQIKPQGVNVLLPVRVLGRKASGQPWTPLANSVAYSLAMDGSTAADGTTQNSGPFELAASTFREIKIEADQKTPGFAAPPDITLLFEPAQIVFLTSGQPPFTLAVGLSQAASTYLPIQTLIPAYQSGQENALPLARIETAVMTRINPSVSAQSASDAMPRRNLVLWAVLLLGTLALALMAWVLIKPGKPAQALNDASNHV